jgi:RNA polymerase sigma factor (TIGR02999 family)
MTDVTHILGEIEDGDPSAVEKLLPLVYEELRKLAAAKMAVERGDHSLQPTGLVHEAYLRLVDVEKVQKWNSRGHFFGAAAEAMRRILVENARRKQRVKHGGEHKRVDVDELAPVSEAPAGDLLMIHEALESLDKVDRPAAELVKLRYFAGLTIPQAAEVLGISPRSADSLWAYAKAWLLEFIELK